MPSLLHARRRSSGAPRGPPPTLGRPSASSLSQERETSGRFCRARRPTWPSTRHRAAVGCAVSWSPSLAARAEGLRARKPAVSSALLIGAPASQCWCSCKPDHSNARLRALQAQLARSAFTRPAEVCSASASCSSSRWVLPACGRGEERASRHWRQSPRARRLSCLARCHRGAARPAELALRRVAKGLRPP